VIVLDTTVLLYAVGSEHELREPCRRLLAAPRSVGLTTTAGVLQEFVHVRARRRPHPDAVELGRAYLTLLKPLVDVPDTAVDDALDLLGEHASLGAFDAILAATSRRSGCEAIVTADRAFAEIDGLEVVFPNQGGIDGLLSGLRRTPPLRPPST